MDFLDTAHPPSGDPLGGLEAGDFSRRWAVVQIPESFILNVEDVVEARQRSDDVAVLLVEVLESGIFMENIHALPLAEYHPNRTVLEYQARLSSEKNTHLLMKQ
mgnify:CR=1 FL=1